MIKNRIFLYPPINERAILNSVVSRLSWYFTPYVQKIESIQYSVSDSNIFGTVSLAPHLDPMIAERIPEIEILMQHQSEQSLVRELLNGNSKHDILLIIDEDAEVSASGEIKKKIAEFSRNGGCYRVDHERTRQEGSHYLWAGLNKLSDAAALTAEHATRFKQMAAEIGQYDRAYVFGTGPSFSEYIESHDFSDGLCIVANSIVKNDLALERLKPRIICAADPIYHAGCSSYAAAFRKSLSSALEKTGAWFVCPLRDAGVYRAFLPEHLQARMVCIPFDNTKCISTDLTREFYIKPFPNVLTLLLLPLASTFAQSIHVVGCDGRRLLDDSFFWAHDKKVQFNEQMIEIQAVHPGFFAIDYNDYYLDHCLDLENVIVRLEEAGKHLINETSSLIPALEHRSRSRSSVQDLDLKTFVMLDPDAKDDWGHFLAYDKRLATAVKDNGLNFALLCRKELKEKFKPEDANSMHPVFTVNSWTVGNKTLVERKNVLKFVHELEDGIVEVENTYKSGHICLFFYVGSVEVAEILEFLLAEHPRIVAVVNLFWSYNFDQNDPAYVVRWKPIVQRIDGHPRLHIMHATAQIANEFAQDWGVRLPVLEHPSTTFSDADARALSARPVAMDSRHATPLRVVFPGGARAEKGFILSIEVMDLLRDVPNVQLALRARLDKVSGSKLHKAFENLDKSGIEIIDQDLSDDEFIDMIRCADIVVIPYHADAFRRRTSGILVDAMLLGKPVVVIEGTWLADIVKVEGIGVCVAPDASSLADGILHVGATYDHYARHIEKARNGYLHHNTWGALVRSVCSIAGAPKFRRMFVEADSSFLSNGSTTLAYILLKSAADMLLDREPDSLVSDSAVKEALAVLGANHPAVMHYERVKKFCHARTAGKSTLALASG